MDLSSKLIHVVGTYADKIFPSWDIYNVCVRVDVLTMCRNEEYGL